MGKYKRSLIHDKFSDWHWRKCKKNAYLTDVDRIWVEIRKKKIIGVFDLKRMEWKTPDRELTFTEEILLHFFEDKNNIPFYVVQITDDFKYFFITRPKLGYKAYLTEEEMIEWIDRDLDEKFLLRKLDI